MDTQSIVMIGAIVIANIGTTIGLFIWATTHASQATQNHRSETIAILKAIADEMKDFHGRLCSLEERNKQK